MVSASHSPRSLTPQAFECLLGYLAPDRDEAGREYERVRRTLLSFFGWRGCRNPGEQADETLDRVARRLVEGESVGDIHRYVYGVARRVFSESAKRRVREAEVLSGLHAFQSPSPTPGAEERSACLDRCLLSLSEDARVLLADYYEGQGEWHMESRKALAERLGITYGALKVRAHRARCQLESCLRDCLREKGADPE